MRGSPERERKWEESERKKIVPVTCPWVFPPLSRQHKKHFRSTLLHAVSLSLARNMCKSNWEKSLRQSTRGGTSHTPFRGVSSLISSVAAATNPGALALPAAASATAATPVLLQQGATAGHCTCACALQVAALQARLASLEARLPPLYTGAVVPCSATVLGGTAGAAAASISDALQHAPPDDALYLEQLCAVEGSTGSSVGGGHPRPATPSAAILVSGSGRGAAGACAAVTAARRPAPPANMVGAISSSTVSHSPLLPPADSRPTQTLALLTQGASLSPPAPLQRTGSPSPHSHRPLRVPFLSFTALRTFENLLLLERGELPGFLGKDLKEQWWSTGSSQRSKLRRILSHMRSLGTAARESFMGPKKDGTFPFTTVYDSLRNL